VDFLELCGQSGPIAILCNGPSLPVDRLEDIQIPTLGMNRTHFFPSTYYLALEPDWLGVEFAGKYFLNAGINLDPSWTDRGVRVPLQWANEFSMSATYGFYAGQTGYLAGQVALGLGYKTVYYLGLDIVGGHFDGTPAADIEPKHFELMARCLEGTDKRVYICESPFSKCTAFPHRSINEITGARYACVG